MFNGKLEKRLSNLIKRFDELNTDVFNLKYKKVGTNETIFDLEEEYVERVLCFDQSCRVDKLVRVKKGYTNNGIYVRIKNDLTVEEVRLLDINSADIIDRTKEK